jgi:glyoxylase-like metal-dependent hydrolase (beta-lactamase superfamily II)
VTLQRLSRLSLFVPTYPLVGSVYVAEDSHYAKTNYAVYVAATSVTIIGAGWSPDTAESLAQEIRKVTNKPIKDVILPDHDPEYTGGSAYWKRIGAMTRKQQARNELLTVPKLPEGPAQWPRDPRQSLLS